MKKETVAILYGGRSVEHGVSINSARNIFEFIDRSKFIPIPIGLSTEGEWYLNTAVSKNITLGKPLSIRLDPANPYFFSGNERINVDIIFPVLHGTDGEDGSVQGMLTTMNLPFVGAGVLGSSIAMNKVVAKNLLISAGLPVARFLSFSRQEKSSISFEHISQQFGLPFMVKAASLGSSVGISKVKSEKEFSAAVEDSFSYDEEIIIEEFIRGREIECAILGNNPPQASNPGEIIVSGKYDFYTFDAKYVDAEAVKIEVPAKIDIAISDKIKQISIKAFQALRCQDYARVDLFLRDQKEVFVNEINTIPGFTNSSMFPMMWKERGVAFKDLITRLIETAFQRKNAQSLVNRNFQSSLKY